MALKITAPVYTDKGVTNECYVRINQYYLDKMSGYLKVELGVYTSPDAAATAKPDAFGAAKMQDQYMCKTYQFPDFYLFENFREEQRERQVDRGSKGIETVIDTVKVVDFSEFHAAPDSFAYLYEKVKAKLVEVFQEVNVINV